MHNLFDDLAVVENAGNLLERPYGLEIDDHMNVARFNNYDIHNFRESTGTKTTIWVTSTCTDINPQRLQEFQGPILCPLPRELLGTRYRVSKAFEGCDVEHIDLDMFNEINRACPNPSTGIAFLYWLWCENGPINPVNVFGFSFFEGKHHYHDDKSACNHHGNVEKRFAETHLFAERPMVTTL